MTRAIRVGGGLFVCGLLAFAFARNEQPTTAQEPKAKLPADDYATTVQPLVKKYCLGCHSTKAKKGSLDLERFTGIHDIRKDLKAWQNIVEQIEAGQMPPEEKPQLSADEKKKLLAWIRGFLDSEA